PFSFGPFPNWACVFRSHPALQCLNSLFTNEPQDRFGCTHLTYLLGWGLRGTCPARGCRSTGSGRLSPAAPSPCGRLPSGAGGITTLPTSDYYGGSVTIGLASRRPSRIPKAIDVRV